MALVKSDDVLAQLRGLSHLPALRQIGLLVGLAASIALGVAVALWSKEPGYRLLYAQLSAKDAAAVTASLDQAGIPYRIAEDSGSILVPGSEVHNARLKLAGQGLPNGAGVGFELLEKNQGFGVSQFMETARYQRAIEGELARTISSLAYVEEARVHLAIPPRTSFLRDRREPSASVMVRLFAGHSLEESHAAAIVNLVASSVPNLSPDKVTVVDQQGRLLTRQHRSEETYLSDSQFAYRKRLEEYYSHRIETILAPVVGPDSVRAQVTADIDFTMTEQTQETFNPDLPAIRSEQTLEESAPVASAGEAIGVPGAASNQPNAASGADAGASAAPENASTKAKTTSRVVRNYELDKTVSHTRLVPGSVRRLSVAVVVDDKQVGNGPGGAERAPHSPEELTRLTELVKEAVGFNAQRGDSVNVINAAFTPSPVPQTVPAPGLLEQPWLWDSLKAVLGGVGLLVLVFGVLRPVMRDLAARGRALPAATPAMAGAVGAGSPGAVGAAAGGAQLAYPGNVDGAKSLVSEDPRRVAQVVKDWVGDDGQ